MKAILSFFAAMIIVLVLPLTIFASNISVTLDDVPIEFDVAPQIIDSRTMVPLRAIFNALGADIEWNDETRTVISVRYDVSVILQIDNDVMVVDGRDITLDVAPMIIDGRTLVPVRAIAESFGVF